jgi:hypothetical protein
MNAKLVTIEVYDNRSPAAGHLEGLNGERHAVAAEMFDRLVEVIYFEDHVQTVA